MVRTLNAMWPFDPVAAVPGNWTCYDVGASVVYESDQMQSAVSEIHEYSEPGNTDERLPHRYTIWAVLLSYLAIDKRAHHRRVHIITSCHTRHIPNTCDQCS